MFSKSDDAKKTAIRAHYLYTPKESSALRKVQDKDNLWHENIFGKTAKVPLILPNDSGI